MTDPTTPLDTEKIADWQQRAVAWFQGDPEKTGQRAAYLLVQHTPALLAALAEAQRERDELDAEIETLRQDLADQTKAAFANQAEANRMRPVVEAAGAYRELERGPWDDPAHTVLHGKAYDAFCAAVDTYETQEGTE